MLARECILDVYHDRCKNRRTRTSTVLMDTVRERDEVWETVKTILGHDHVIFNTVTPKDKTKKRPPGMAPVKEIEALVYALRLERWRRESKCENLLHLNDEQKKQVVDTLQTLIDKLKAWGVAVRGP